MRVQENMQQRVYADGLKLGSAPQAGMILR